MRKSRFLAGLAALAVTAVGFPANADNVPVTLSNPAGSRTLHVEKIDGTALNGLDFGTNRSVPFRVRVVDSAFNRQSFSVSATMTHLYQAPNGSAVHSLTPILSEKVTLGHQVNPLNVSDVKAIVQPVLDTTSRLLDPVACGLLNLAVVVLDGQQGCVLSGSDVLGKVTEVTVPVNLANLPALPLVPQLNETGAFLDAEYGLGTAGSGDSRGTNAPGPTKKKVLAGTPNPTDLTALQTALSALNLNTALVDNQKLLEELVANYPLLSTLPSSTLSSVVGSTVATLDLLTVDNILKQTGTYVALPTLNVAVPPGADAGGYLGTLVITALQ